MRHLEIWRPVPVPGYEAKYEVSNLGRLRSWSALGPGAVERTASPKIMRPERERKMGYLRARLCIEDQRVRHFLHRLVLDAFVGPCPPGHVAAHIDGNPQNNKVTNLAWVTQRENMVHRDLHGTTPRGEKNGESKLTSDKVTEIRTMFSDGHSVPEIRKRIAPDVTREAIYAILKRKTWRHIA